MTDRSHQSFYTQYMSKKQSDGVKHLQDGRGGISRPVAAASSDAAAGPSSTSRRTTTITTKTTIGSDSGGKRVSPIETGGAGAAAGGTERRRLKSTPPPPRVRESIPSIDFVRNMISSTSRVNASKSSFRFEASNSQPCVQQQQHEQRAHEGQGGSGNSWQSRSNNHTFSVDSAFRRTATACSNRLFQTPSQTIHHFDHSSSQAPSSAGEAGRSQRLQATGLLDRIKSLQLTTAIGEQDEDEDEDGNSFPKTDSHAITCVATQNDNDRRVHPDQGPSNRLQVAGNGIADHENDNDTQANESVVYLDQQVNQIHKFPIQKKFTLNYPNSRTKTSATESGSLHQTTIDRYFHKIGNPAVATASNTIVNGESQSCGGPALASVNTAFPAVPDTACSASSKEDQHQHEVQVVTRDPVDRSAGPPAGGKDIISENQGAEKQEKTSSSRREDQGLVREGSGKETVDGDQSCNKTPGKVSTSSPLLVSRRRSKSEANLPSAVKAAVQKSLQKSHSRDSLKVSASKSSASSSGMELKRLKIKNKTYFLLSLLGQGGSAKVYQVYDPVTHQNLAVKVVDLSSADESIRAGYENEVSLLRKLSKCQRVVKLLDYERVKGSNGQVKRLFLVMEKGDTDLANVLKQFVERDPGSSNGFSLDPHLIKHYWKEMIKAVNEIHELDVVHSDLKPVNFIIVAGKLKLIDFGIANAIETDHTSVFKDNQIGTINYMAPEALQSRNDVERPYGFSSSKPLIKFNCKADVWSLGCILYNLVYGRPPFGHLPSLYAKVQAICSPREKIDFPHLDDEHLIDCLKRCLDRDPKNRPTAKELLVHPYLSGRVVKPASTSSSSSSHLGANSHAHQLINQINSLTPNRMQVLSRFVENLTHK